MKKFSSFILLTVLALFIVSCNNNSDTKAAEKQENNISGTSTDSELAPTTSPIKTKVESTSQSLSTQDQPALNPPHGQPGHDCKVAVGAPLNSSTIINSQPNPGIKQVQKPSTAIQPLTTAPGMNPPHGQPGHDCKIAVGAPLK